MQCARPPLPDRDQGVSAKDMTSVGAGALKCALKERRALWQIDVQVRRHHDQLQRHKDTRDLKAGEPLETTPEPGLERWWDAESPQEDVQSSASVRNDLDGVRRCEKRGKHSERGGSLIGNAPARRPTRFASC
jgi:hypothetical protein